MINKYYIYRITNKINGKKQSEETIRKRVEKNTGKKRSEEQKRKLSEALKGKSHQNKGELK